MKKIAEIREKPLISAGICREKIRQTWGNHFDFLRPVVTVNILNLAVNHVMGRDIERYLPGVYNVSAIVKCNNLGFSSY